jgi:hypothetical protein
MNTLITSYWELRKIVEKLIPRALVLEPIETFREGLIREKGRKTNYRQFDLESKQFEKSERLLNLEEMSSFLEISLRSQACPMSLNMDVWDGLQCIAQGQKVLTSEGWFPIEEIKVGSLVASYNEKTKEVEFLEVLYRKESVKEDLIEIETEEGILRCTSDHEIYTQRGWTKAKDLTEEDVLLKIKS